MIPINPAINYRPVTSAVMPPLPPLPPLPPSPDNSHTTVIASEVTLADLLAIVKPLIQEEIISATERSFKYADVLNRERSNEMSAKIQKLQDKLNAAASPTTVIAGISINGADHAAITPELTPYRTQLITQIMQLAAANVAKKNYMLVGPAGVGKTTLASQLAQALKLAYGSVSCSIGMSETWLLGRQTPNGYVSSSFVDIYRNGGVFLIDEMDAADANALIVVNSALDNGYFYNPISGESLARHKDCIILAGCNTFGRGGDSVYMRNRLDGATLSRFRLLAQTHDLELERKLCPDKKLLEKLWAVRLKLIALSSDEMITTRHIRDAYLATAHTGESHASAYKAITMPWVAGLAEQVGLVSSDDADDTATTTVSPAASGADTELPF